MDWYLYRDNVMTMVLRERCFNERRIETMETDRDVNAREPEVTTTL